MDAAGEESAAAAASSLGAGPGAEDVTLEDRSSPWAAGYGERARGKRVVRRTKKKRDGHRNSEREIEREEREKRL